MWSAPQMRPTRGVSNKKSVVTQLIRRSGLLAVAFIIRSCPHIRSVGPRPRSRGVSQGKAAMVLDFGRQSIPKIYDAATFGGHGTKLLVRAMYSGYPGRVR